MPAHVIRFLDALEVHEEFEDDFEAYADMYEDDGDPRSIADIMEDMMAGLFPTIH